MNIVENIKIYFKRKSENKDVGESPVGICPNCWGKQEWEGDFYKRIKVNNITPDNNTYDNFIHEVANKLDKIILKEDIYECETCGIKRV